MNAFARAIIAASSVATLFAQGTWTWSGRTHPELDWFTLETEHFHVHYHNGLEEISRRTASIAEQVRPTLLQQMGVQEMGKVDVTVTAEDEILNGYAMWTNQVFIWVDQNSAAVWLEDEKWLFQVVAHELQHVVLMNALRTWLPEPFGSFILSGTPGWFVEGTAEYYTERWRPYRADLSHKLHVLKNEMTGMDPHHDGFSKMLYWADRFGDSTIVKLAHYRNSAKLFRFKTAFKEVTGVELKRFEEDWRRQMNTYFYGYRAQKEAIEETGRTATLPIKRVSSFAFSPDSLRIAIIGRESDDELDETLVIATLDTSRPKPARLEEWKKKVFKPAKGKREKAPRPRYDKKPVDYGIFGGGLGWSPDGKQLAYSKYHYGKHQSLIFDLKVIDEKSGKSRWITESLRADQPSWSPDGSRIAFVAHANNTSNLFTISPDGTDRTALTAYTGDVQIVSPAWSPDGNQVACGVAGPDGNMNLVLVSPATGVERTVTSSAAVDYLPIWHADGKKITFTSHEESTPNLHTVELESGIVTRNTDVGDAVWGVQWTPKGSTITAQTLSDVDSVRIVQVDPARAASTDSLSLRDHFASWRSHAPSISLARANPDAPVAVVAERPYSALRQPKLLTWLALPYLNGSGGMGLVAFTDGMGRHIFQGSAGTADEPGSDPFLFVTYTNAAAGPILGASYFFNSRWNSRYYDGSDSGLQERLDGVQFSAQQTHNRGEALSASHTIRAALSLQRRIVSPVTDSAEETDSLAAVPHPFVDLPAPEDGKEAVASLAYLWLSRRPDLRNLTLPKHGWGLLARMRHADARLFGDFTYTRWTLDGFSNVAVGGPAVLYLRVKGEAMEGDPPAQEFVGLSKDPTIYLPGGVVESDFVSLGENHHPRGWDGVRLGDRLVFGTVELRLPLAPNLPLQILGVTLGSVTAAVFSDFGNAWSAGKSRQDWVATAGYEAKVAVKVGKTPIVNVALGRAFNTALGPESVTSYVRLALINPF